MACGFSSRAMPARPRIKPPSCRPAPRARTMGSWNSATQSGIVYTRIDDRPAATIGKARFMSAMPAAICPSPTDRITGTSRRSGSRRPRRTTSSTTITARPVVMRKAP